MFLKYLVYGVCSEVIVVSSGKIQVFPWKIKFKELVLCITFSHSSMSHMKAPLPNILLNSRWLHCQRLLVSNCTYSCQIVTNWVQNFRLNHLQTSNEFSIQTFSLLYSETLKIGFIYIWAIFVNKCRRISYSVSGWLEGFSIIQNDQKEMNKVKD